MKKILFLSLCVMLLSSCGEPSYEKVITEYLEQQNQKVFGLDVSVQLEEFVDKRDITVGDSIEILKKNFEEQKSKLLQTWRDQKKEYEAWFERNKDIKFDFQKKRYKEYTKRYAEFDPAIDSLEAVQFVDTVYVGKKKSKVLAKAVRYKCSAFFITKYEETVTFILTPDMKRVITDVVEKKDKDKKTE